MQQSYGLRRALGLIQRRLDRSYLAPLATTASAHYLTRGNLMFSWVRRSQASRQLAGDEEGLVLVGSGVVAPSSRVLPPMVEEWR